MVGSFVLLVGNIHIHFIYGSKGRIRIRILQKGTDPTGSGSATLARYLSIVFEVAEWWS